MVSFTEAVLSPKRQSIIKKEIEGLGTRFTVREVTEAILCNEGNELVCEMPFGDLGKEAIRSLEACVQ